MADHLGSPPHDPRPKGWFTRARGHLVDVTPLKVSRDFRRLFIGRSISDFGDEIVAVVVPFQVYEITGSTLAVGLIGLVELVPVLVFPILGGAFADALERRRLTITTHTILAAMSALMAVNAFLDEPLLWPLYVFAFISAGLYTFNRPGLDTWPARLLARDLLPSANALEAGFGTLDSMLGPVAAGILLFTIAPGGAFAFDAVTFLIVIAQIARMRPSPPTDDENEVSWEAIKDGFRFLEGKRTLQSVFLVDLNAMVFGFPIALFPAVAQRLGGDEVVLGLLYAAPAAGSFLATMLSGRAKHVRRQGARDPGRGARLERGDRRVRPLGVGRAVARDAGGGRRRRHGERHLPHDDPAGGGGGPAARTPRRHRHGRVGDRTVARERGIGRGRVAHERAVLHRLRRPAHDRGGRRAAVVRSGILAIRRA